MSAKKYKLEVIDELKIGETTRSNVLVTLDGNKYDLDVEDVKTILKGLESNSKKNNEDIKVLIRGLNPHQWFTLKGYDQDFDSEAVEEYYSADVKNPAKFEKFKQLQVTIIKSPK